MTRRVVLRHGVDRAADAQPAQPVTDAPHNGQREAVVDHLEEVVEQEAERHWHERDGEGDVQEGEPPRVDRGGREAAVADGGDGCDRKVQRVHHLCEVSIS